jgi:hypothetical protein
LVGPADVVTPVHAPVHGALLAPMIGTVDSIGITCRKKIRRAARIKPPEAHRAKYRRGRAS